MFFKAKLEALDPGCFKMGKKLARHLHVGLISGTSTHRLSCGIWVTKIRTWIHGWPLGIIKALSIIFNGRKITNEQVNGLFHDFLRFFNHSSSSIDKIN